MRIKRSIYEMQQIAGILLTDTTPLRELFELLNRNIINERNGFEESTLFDCLTNRPQTFSGQQWPFFWKCEIRS